ncbi:hypothetical protein [Streptomyces parvus]|uniref:hypothetical protein n=1 Tax=Streptomyces parvus TaxID=66428 RepID=UPI00344C6EC9
MTGDGVGRDAAGEALAEAARERLRSGAAPAAVCGELAARAGSWWGAALAVGRARGISEPELRRRLHADPDKLRREFRTGEEELYGEFLAGLGVFDVPARLDERELVVAEHLRTAIRAMGGVASGRALGLSRGLVTGELAGVFRSLARTGPRAGRGRPGEFWEALVAAGELLDPADRDDRGTVAQALDVCRRRLTDSIGPGEPERA